MTLNWKIFKRLADDLAQLRGLRPHPLIEVRGFGGEKGVSLFVKVEHDNCDLTDPLRSVKRKPATLMGAFACDFNPHKSFWITASSGNFAIELGVLANEMGKKVFAVIPPRTPKQKIETLKSLGVDVVSISKEEYNSQQGDLTVSVARMLSAKYSNVVNVDQYSSILNPFSHIIFTAREIDEAIGGEVTHIFTPLGSTGTITGIYEHFSKFYPKVRIIGVQPAKVHRIPGVRNIIGEYLWRPEIFGLVDASMVKVLTVDDISAYKALMELEIEYNIHGGPSTGMVFAAVKREVETGNIGEGSVILMISADSSWDYREWNMEVLMDLKDGLGAGEMGRLNKYINMLKNREDSLLRVTRIKNIYKPKLEGKVYSLEEFKELLTKI
ncbi:MAG: pyridoxal-phosphate dependent enzyme [Candidatus Bathyarchaeia archaeon]